MGLHSLCEGVPGTGPLETGGGTRVGLAPVSPQEPFKKAAGATGRACCRQHEELKGLALPKEAGRLSSHGKRLARCLREQPAGLLWFGGS